MLCTIILDKIFEFLNSNFFTTLEGSFLTFFFVYLRDKYKQKKKVKAAIPLLINELEYNLSLLRDSNSVEEIKPTIALWNSYRSDIFDLYTNIYDLYILWLNSYIDAKKTIYSDADNQCTVKYEYENTIKYIKQLLKLLHNEKERKTWI